MTDASGDRMRNDARAVGRNDKGPQQRRLLRPYLILGTALGILASSTGITVAEALRSSYAQTVAEDGPVAWWRMTRTESGAVADLGNAPAKSLPLDATVVGRVQLGAEGPFGEEFPNFKGPNDAIQLSDGANFLRVVDPGPNSELDFDNDDEITIEAWICPDPKSPRGYRYLVGKGRTFNPGVSQRNQNYSLRLDNRGGGARLSFFFVDAESEPSTGHTADGHRWTSNAEVPLDHRWHHVAISYVFGKPDSIRGFIDGKATIGKWDLAGPTTKRPIIDDDELWIGASMGGKATFLGAIDEVAIYRRALTPAELERHVEIRRRDEVLEAVREVAASAVTDRVQVDEFESISGARSWTYVPYGRQRTYESDVFALVELPRKYDGRGVITDRAAPVLLHAYARVALPAGEYELALRSLNSARLYVDDELLAETEYLPISANGHGDVYKLAESTPYRLSLPAAHHEEIVRFTSDGTSRVFSVLAVAGLSNRPIELGELVVSYGKPGEKHQLLGVNDLGKVGPLELRGARQFDDRRWREFLARDAARRREWEAADRADRGKSETAYWAARHAWARERTDRIDVPAVPADHEAYVNNNIDRFVQARLDAEGITPAPVIDDLAFLRRVTLDVAGWIPSAEEIDAYLAEPAETRRASAVDRLLADPAWADHWVGYWQHVLAENPGLTKPTLNNSGPFRWYLHESFLDNKPYDRMVTELVRMESGRRSGGPAGFAVATNNDVPMAHKAHVVSTAFLGVEMKCARCHDAPSHASTQRELFNVAAMLARKPIKLPKSSSVPASPEQLARMAITVSLKPGEAIQPEWPFDDFSASADSAAEERFLRNPDNSRARLAWQITRPENERFAQVAVNRVWARYLGRGLVEPVHDWEGTSPSHPELLRFLAAEFVRSNYDLKSLARMILTSQVYQRAHVSVELRDSMQAVFAAATRRRMQAEQVADSIYRAAGKPFDTEEMCVNPDGRQAAATFSNLGTPRRAWEFASTSNERERPSMSLPRAQGVVDLMMAFGWRQSRQEPVNYRENDLTPLSPLALANGAAVNRAVDLADHAEVVEICLEDQPVEALVNRLFVRYLSRSPIVDEQERYVELLSVGYEVRKTGLPARERKIDRSPLAWSNNLDPEANQIGELRQRRALDGDPPTRRLKPEWRKRVEDMLWVLVNSPEFLHIP
mgnify:FL=1